MIRLPTVGRHWPDAEKCKNSLYCRCTILIFSSYDCELWLVDGGWVKFYKCTKLIRNLGQSRKSCTPTETFFFFSSYSPSRFLKATNAMAKKMHFFSGRNIPVDTFRFWSVKWHISSLTNIEFEWKFRKSYCFKGWYAWLPKRSSWPTDNLMISVCSKSTKKRLRRVAKTLLIGTGVLLKGRDFGYCDGCWYVVIDCGWSEKDDRFYEWYKTGWFGNRVLFFALLICHAQGKKLQVSLPVQKQMIDEGGNN